MQNKKHNKLGPNVSITPCTVLDLLDVNDESRESESTDTEEEMSVSSASTSRQQRSETNDGTKSTNNEEKSKKKKVVSLKKVKKKLKKEQLESNTTNFTDTTSEEEPVIKGKKRKENKRKRHKKESESSDEKYASAQDADEVNASTKKTKPLVPVSFSLDSLVSKYLKTKPQLTAEVAEKFQVVIEITDESSGTVTLSPSCSSPPDWAIKSKEMLINSTKQVDIPVPQQVKDVIYKMMMTVSKEMKLQCAFGQGGNVVSVAGDIASVKKLVDDVNGLSNIKVEEIIPVNPEDYAYLRAITLPSIHKTHATVSIKSDHDNCTVTLIGSIRDVQQLKEMFPQYLAHCTVPVNLLPLAVQFLKENGNHILQELIKGMDHIVPFFTVESESILILSSQDYVYKVLAENVATKICEKISTKRVPLPKSYQSKVAGSLQFSTFRSNLMKKYAFIASTIDDQNQLILVSTTNDIEKVCEEFSVFITKECSITESIQLKKGVWRLFHSHQTMEKKWTDFVNEIKINQVSIISSSKLTAPKPFITFEGETHNVEQAIKQVLALQDSIKEKEIPIARPGISQYLFGDRGKIVVSGIESEAKVCIELEVIEDKKNDGATTGQHQQPTRVCFGNTPEAKTINVYVGDITEFNKADVIVNAANECLKHAGGVALAISEKGGSVIQKDSDKYVSSTYGKVAVGSAVILKNTGTLPPSYKAIVHAVGPKWSGKEIEKDIALLKRAVYLSLKQSKDYFSIAIPAISSGMFGFPVHVCASALIEAVLQFSKKESQATLNEFNFIILEDNVDAFIQATKNHMEDVKEVKGAALPSIILTNNKTEFSSGHQQRKSIKPPSESTHIASRKFHLVDVYKLIKITKGDITKHQVNYMCMMAIILLIQI